MRIDTTLTPLGALTTARSTRIPQCRRYVEILEYYPTLPYHNNLRAKKCQKMCRFQICKEKINLATLFLKKIIKTDKLIEKEPNLPFKGTKFGVPPQNMRQKIRIDY